jgi:uncharacterized lipoprotein YddW (UPF0748 family)
MARIKLFFALVWLLPATLFAADEIFRPAILTPPQPMREFRGAWIATVANKDWPSKPGLSVAEQKAELISLLDRAAQLKLNAVIFQVRPMCDAMYASPIEPWSEYLTGTQGHAPEPFYDPLTFAIAEAHKRGMELHAWFNPFRARHSQARSSVAPNHISQTHPELICKYGDQFLLNPGEPAVRDYVLRVVMDVVKRYDVDGVQFDDYFYPYPQKDPAGRELDFPDEAAWRKFGAQSGLSRDDWRRANVNQFIQSVYQNIKAVKPWVKFGVSPFGIWRPHFPGQIQGFDAYSKLYADSRLWLASGWLDYFAPQLYWPIDAPQQSFPVLLQWWDAQNVKGRHIWPGLGDSAAGQKFPPEEIARQIQIVREHSNGGEIHFHLRSILENHALDGIVRSEYAQPALVPASPWLDSTSPDNPKVTVVKNGDSGWRVSWKTSGGEPPWLWVLQFHTNGVWTTEILPAPQMTQIFANTALDLISISTVDRTGNLSSPAALKKILRFTPGKARAF